MKAPTLNSAIVNGHEATLLGRFLIDRTAIPKYSGLRPEHFGSPVHREIFEAILALHYDGYETNFVAVEDYFRRRGKLHEIGEHTLSTLGADSRVTAMDDSCFDYAQDCLLDAFREREGARIGKDLAAGKITADFARERLTEIQKSLVAEGQREPRIRFFAPSELRNFQPDSDIVLVGDCQIMRGEVFVIGGEPGVGKSLSATQLGVSGATRRNWFGLTLHRQFRTMIVQTENSRYRLQQEFSQLNGDEIENWIRVSEPPPFGLTLRNPEFQADIGGTLDAFKPDCVIFDPWNAAARDDKQRDYAETFDALRNLLPTGADKPALGIVAHTRKPQPNENRTGGTGLMHLLAGSYILTSVPRCIFVIVRGSQDETDDSVVWFNPKNSNGENAPRSAWHRKLSGFTPATDFDWKEFDKPPDERKIVGLEHLREVFGNGTRRLELKNAAHNLATLVGISENAAYNALRETGKFSTNLSRNDGMLTFHSSKSSKKNSMNE